MSIRDGEAIQEYMAELSTEAREIREDIANICWHMRSMGREEAWSLSWDERLDIKKLIKERVSIVKETGLPLL